MPEHTITRKTRNLGWGWTTQPTGRNAYEIETPTRPDYTGTIRQIREQIADDRSYNNLGGAFSNTAWFVAGKHIVSAWMVYNTTDLDGGDPNAKWEWGWIRFTTDLMEDFYLEDGLKVKTV